MAKMYVAYGSNLNLNQMARRCPNAKVVGIGSLKNYQLTFRRVATIEPVDGAVTPVGVWEISPKDERNLDIYEKRINETQKMPVNEKYAFRCFLLRLGLIGDDYKAARKYLLRNLDGDSAFKGGKRNAISE